jgi:hypothetical protein
MRGEESEGGRLIPSRLKETRRMKGIGMKKIFSPRMESGRGLDWPAKTLTRMTRGGGCPSRRSDSFVQLEWPPVHYLAQDKL